MWLRPRRERAFWPALLGLVLSTARVYSVRCINRAVVCYGAGCLTLLCVPALSLCDVAVLALVMWPFGGGMPRSPCSRFLRVTPA